MADAGELGSLLASGEQAVFHGRPADAVTALEAAVVLAGSQHREAETAGAFWLLGVALGAAGRYGGALTVLSPLVETAGLAGAAAERQLFGALASSTIASVHRQLGRHAVARDADLTAQSLAGPTGEGAFDAQLGLAADAVGLDDEVAARTHAAAAERLIPAGAADWWRQRVRLGWVQADLALLAGRAVDAAQVAQLSVDRAEEAQAPRHVAKSLLYLGIAQVTVAHTEGGPRLSLAAETLRRAAILAESLGTVPLVWPARALLGAVAAGSDSGESTASLAAARSGVLTIAADLPPGVRGEWLARPDVAALLEG